jgi:hypothetical protein
MRIFRQARVCGAASAFLAILGAQVVARADDAPTGEIWQATTSMEMAGMTMPPRTSQVCVPKGKAEEALSKPQGPGMGDNCSVQDAKQEGNRYSAKFICTGKQAVQGTVETIFGGDHATTRSDHDHEERLAETRHALHAEDASGRQVAPGIRGKSVPLRRCHSGNAVGLNSPPQYFGGTGPCPGRKRLCRIRT